MQPAVPWVRGGQEARPAANVRGSWQSAWNEPVWSQFQEGRLASGMTNWSRLLNWLDSQFTDLFLSMVGGVINDLATPALQPGQALFWLPRGLRQAWRRPFLLLDLGAVGVSKPMEP